MSQAGATIEEGGGPVLDDTTEQPGHDGSLAAATRQRLAELTDLPTGDHVGVFDAIHQELAAALAEMEGTAEDTGQRPQRGTDT